MARALWRIRACPERAGAALSRAIETMGSLLDTTELERRTWLTHYLVDDRIIMAAAGVAGGQENSPEARVFALRTLIWQKAPGHSIAAAALMEESPGGRDLSISSSYTSHYYTDLGYGSGEHPWPVLGDIPKEGYVVQLNRLVGGIRVVPGDDRVANARDWFLQFPQDSQLMRRLEAARQETGWAAVTAGPRLPKWPF